MSSQTCSVFDIFGAFKAAEDPDFLGPNRVWNSINPPQEEFFQYNDEARHLVAQLQEEGLIDFKVDWEASVVNDWMAQKGFAIKLTDMRRPDYFYVGSVYRQLIHWLRPGTELDLMAANGRTYPGALLDGGLSFYDSAKGMVAAVATTGNDVAYFMPMTVPTASPFGLMQTALSIQKNLEPKYGYGELSFPMVNLDVTTDVSWLVGANTVSDRGQKAKVAQALQQSKLKLNHLSALAESGFLMSMLMEACFTKDRMAIDSPFLFWIARQGVPFPMFTAWVDYDTWENPGEIK